MGQLGFNATTKKTTREEENQVATTSIIECVVCGDKLWYKDYGSHNAADCCECKNLKIGMLPATQPAKFEAFLTIRYETEPPKIYEVPYKEYFNRKQDFNT